MLSIPQSTTIRVPLQAYLASDHVSAATGKTIAITISKNGGAYGNPSGGATNATEIANGSYYVDLSTTDTGTLGPVFVRGAVATVDDVIAIYNVVKATNGGWTGIADAVAGASGGLLISGSNSGTTTFGAMTCTGSFTISDGLLVSRSSSNSSAITATGSGTGSGIVTTGGTTGHGLSAVAGATSGNGINANSPTLGDGMKLIGNGNNKYGLECQWLTGVNGSDIGCTSNTVASMSINGNLTGNVTGAVGSVLGSVNSVTGNVGGNVVGSVASVTAGVTVTTNNDKSGYTLTNAGYAAVMTQQLTESYAAKGTVPTPAQALLEMRALLAENAVASTTVTTKKIDGSTTAHTYTLDSSTAPTTITTAT